MNEWVKDKLIHRGASLLQRIGTSFRPVEWHKLISTKHNLEAIAKLRQKGKQLTVQLKTREMFRRQNMVVTVFGILSNPAHSLMIIYPYPNNHKTSRKPGLDAILTGKSDLFKAFVYIES